MHVYLVERYVPSMTATEVESAASRLAAADPGEVRHLCTMLIPGEDTCLSLFEAADASAVEAANAKARFPLDRIVEASMLGSLWGGSAVS